MGGNALGKRVSYRYGANVAAKSNVVASRSAKQVAAVSKGAKSVVL